MFEKMCKVLNILHRRCGWDPKVANKRKQEYREASRPLYRSGMIIKFKEERT